MLQVFPYPRVAAVLALSAYLLVPAGSTGSPMRPAVALAQEQAAGSNAVPARTTSMVDEQVVVEAPVDDSLPSMLDTADLGSGDASLEPVAVDEVDEFALGVYTDVGYYMDEQGRFVMDLLEQDYAYLTVFVTDSDGRSVVGARPEFALKGSSLLLQPDEVGSPPETGAAGTVDFAVIGGDMGLDEVTVSFGDASAELLINVISLEATGFPTPALIDGGIPWNDLMSARVSFDGDGMSVAFPEQVSGRNNELVKLSGYMMPLDPDLVQRRFLLTSNPPSCFFHIPGGPAGAVEVLAPKGIEASWDPVVIEGRFETVANGEYGVIYRLHDARPVEP